MIYTVSIAIYLLALVGVGIYKTKMVKSSEDFMVAGRILPWYILVGTLLATWMGSGSLFSGAGLGYRNGPAALWSSAGAWLGIALIYFIAKRIRNFGKITVPDIFEIRYGNFAAVIATITTVIAYTTIVSYQFRGGGKVLSMVSNGMISLEAGIIITAAFAISYTVLAGMFSVVYTDVVNGVLMTVGVLTALAVMPLAAFTTLACLGGGSGTPPEWMRLGDEVEIKTPEEEGDGGAIVSIGRTVGVVAGAAVGVGIGVAAAAASGVAAKAQTAGSSAVAAANAAPQAISSGRDAVSVTDDTFSFVDSEPKTDESIQYVQQKTSEDSSEFEGLGSMFD